MGLLYPYHHTYLRRLRVPAFRMHAGGFSFRPPGGKLQPANRTGSESRLPFRATTAAAAYESIRPLPVSVLLENVRSLYNVGAFFRTADAAGIAKLYLAGITGYPPQ